MWRRVPAFLQKVTCATSRTRATCWIGIRYPRWTGKSGRSVRRRRPISVTQNQPGGLFYPLINESDKRIERIVEVGYPPLDEVDFDWRVEGQAPQLRMMGDRQPFSARQIEHRNYLFSLVLAPGQQGLLVLRCCASSSSLQLPLTLFDPVTFHVKDQYALTGQMLYFGAMLVMVLFNAFSVSLSCRSACTCITSCS